MEIEGTQEHNRSIKQALYIAEQVGAFIADRVVHVPFVMEIEDTPEVQDGIPG